MCSISYICRVLEEGKAAAVTVIGEWRTMISRLDGGNRVVKSLSVPFLSLFPVYH